MAKNRDEMKEAARAAGLGVADSKEYGRELNEFLAAKNPSMAEMAQMCRELIEEG